MTTYQFDFTVITDGDTEEDALQEAMQLMADYRFAKEAATVTNLDEPVNSRLSKVAALSVAIREAMDDPTYDDREALTSLLDTIDARGNA